VLRDHPDPIGLSLAAQVQVLQSGCGVLRRDWLSLLTLTGDDRSRFLNGLVTCDVRDLGRGDGVSGFFTDAKGHVLSDVVVRAFEDRLWLELPAETAVSIAEHLEKYVVVDRVEIRRSAAWVALTLAGARAAELIASLAKVTVPADASWSHRSAVILGHPVVVAGEARMGTPASSLWVSAAAADDLTAGLLDMQAPVQPQRVGLEAAELVRIEAGIPRFGTDFGPENLPQETGFQDAVSYTKGCYLGQEVVARLHYRGRIARRIRSLQFAAGSPPPVDTALYYEGREAGRVTSAVRLPNSNAGVGLALLQSRAAEPGTRLICEGGEEAEVRHLRTLGVGGRSSDGE
jgi:folate-binding protein YgfZ